MLKFVIGEPITVLRACSVIANINERFLIQEEYYVPCSVIFWTNAVLMRQETRGTASQTATYTCDL